MTTPGDPTDPIGSPPADGDPTSLRQPGEAWDDRPPLEEPEQTKRLALVVVGAIVALVLIGAFAWFTRDTDDDEVTSAPETTEPVVNTTAPLDDPNETTTSTTVEETTTTVAEPGPLGPEDAAVAMWPNPAAASEFTDPEAVATSFATEVLGFTDPIIGPFQGGDGRSGEIEIQPAPDVIGTRVLARMLGPGDRWWAIGASSRDISIDAPQTQATVADPLVLSGQASAFEGTVQVAIFADGSAEPIGRGFVTGSGTAEPGPFQGEVPFASPGSGFGTVVLFTDSPEDGRVLQATAIRVAFGA